MTYENWTLKTAVFALQILTMIAVTFFKGSVIMLYEVKSSYFSNPTYINTKSIENYMQYHIFL